MVQAERPRSSLRIYMDILETVHDEGPTRPTRILYKANLSHDRLVKYLGELVAKKLLEEKQDGESRYYVLTPTGIEFINQVRRAAAFIEGFGLSI